MKCKNCGAEVATGAQHCEYCDSAVVREENVAAAATVASAAVAAGSSTEQRAVQRADIFTEIKQSAAYAQHSSPTRHGRLPGGSGMVMLAPIIFFVFFIGVSLFIASMAIGMAGVAGSHFGAVGAIPALMSIVPIGFVAIGIFMIVRSLKKYQDYKNSPIQGRAVIITSKRTAVSGGSKNHSATTTYFVTAEYEDGNRREFAIMEHSLYGRLAEDDAGVLFTRSEFALDFDRVLSL